MQTQIIYEDEQLFVIYKPAGLATESARVDQTDVLHELRSYLHHSAGLCWLGLVHRLDQPVEGLLAVAKDEKTASVLSSQLRTGQMKKTYHAVLYLPQGYGPGPGREIKLTDDIIKKGSTAEVVTSLKPGNAPEALKRKEAGRKFSEARKAVLTYRILERREDTALAEISLETGRFHQIRCQMASHGMPLLGDPKYGTPESMDISRAMGVKNVALCADSLKFVHPGTGREMKVTITPRNVAFRGYNTFEGEARGD
ncbi:MAG: RluA family pseudouridine synthase [Lachnospiraceae bacterium]|nr:RluA family pseudouridine synthase [Lachnospiraceae bacterium]